MKMRRRTARPERRYVFDRSFSPRRRLRIIRRFLLPILRRPLRFFGYAMNNASREIEIVDQWSARPGSDQPRGNRNGRQYKHQLHVHPLDHRPRRRHSEEPAPDVTPDTPTPGQSDRTTSPRLRELHPHKPGVQ